MTVERGPHPRWLLTALVREEEEEGGAKPPRPPRSTRAVNLQFSPDDEKGRLAEDLPPDLAAGMG